LSLVSKKNNDEIKRIQARISEDSLAAVEASVKDIIAAVKASGDKALEEYSLKFDGFELTKKNLNPSLDVSVKPELKAALDLAKKRIEKFHQAELENSKLKTGWSFTGDHGEKLGVKYDAIDSVAVYIPGGSAPLVSTVLMTVIPAKIAGVKRIVLVSPPPMNEAMIYAAKLAGVDEIYQIGGAQAIAALAYGTESIRAVDKILGPGNIYVSTAKKQVFGKVGIDGIYGPSELAVLADETAKAEYIAADLLSQLEHGSGLESTLLVSLSEKLCNEVKKELEAQIEALKDHKTQKQIETIKSSYENWTALLYEPDLTTAISLINDYAPEHLELQLKSDALNKAIKNINNAAAIFIGNNSCESLGDYLAGPSHCLPTGSSARFSSGLQVVDFMTKTSMIDFSEAKGLNDLSVSVAEIARAEKLEAHARAMEYRVKGKG